MKKLFLTALFVSLASAALAAVRVEITPGKGNASAAGGEIRDHPMTEPVSNQNLKVDITYDKVLRSCCADPDLVVSGRVTNLTARPIGYIRFLFAFEDEHGNVLHAESAFNSQAKTLGDDAEVARILDEKPHFTPIPPGGSDTFTMDAPLPILPRFSKVELYSSDIEP